VFHYFHEFAEVAKFVK